MTNMHADLNEQSTPELYAQLEGWISDRSRYQENTDADTTFRRAANGAIGRIKRVLGKRDLPTRFDAYRAGLHLWEAKYDFLTSLKTHIASDEPLKKNKFVEAMKAQVMLEGHTYVVYVHWRKYPDGHRVFVGLVAWDKLALNTPGSCYTKLGEVEL